MTDTRLPPEFLTDATMDALTDAAHRVHTNALVWSVTHGTDGALPTRSLRLLHPDATQVSRAAAELVACGLWAPAPDGWQVVDFLKHQTPATEMEEARAAARDRKREQRAREKAEAEKVANRRIADRDRKRRKRAEASAAVRRTSAGIPADSPRTVQRTRAGEPQVSGGGPASPRDEDRTGQDSAGGNQLRNYAAGAREDGRLPGESHAARAMRLRQEQDTTGVPAREPA